MAITNVLGKLVITVKSQVLKLRTDAKLLKFCYSTFSGKSISQKKDFATQNDFWSLSLFKLHLYQSNFGNEIE